MTEPRSQVIWRHVHALINQTSTTWPTFCTDVRANYEHAVPPDMRRVEFSSHRDTHQRMLLDAQTLRRFEHDYKFGLPADIEEAMVGALPHVRRQRLTSELAGRYGLLAAPIPNHAGHDDAVGISRMMKETGEALAAVAPMLEDGIIDSNDRRLAKNALQQINDAMAEMISMQARVTAILPDNER